MCRVLHETPLSCFCTIMVFSAQYGLFLSRTFWFCGNCHWHADSLFRSYEHVSISCSWRTQPFHFCQLILVVLCWVPHFHEACWKSQTTCSVDYRFVCHDWKFVFMMASWPFSHCWLETVLIRVPYPVSNMIGTQLFTLCFDLMNPQTKS